MRVLTERTKGKEVDVTDGIKASDERGWAQVLPDPDEPLVHILRRGQDAGGRRLARERVLRALVEEDRGPGGTRPRRPERAEPSSRG